jgi:hypothetical protein
MELGWRINRMSQLKTMTQKWFEEMETFELQTVVQECPAEAAEAVTDLRKEVRVLLAELTKEWEAKNGLVYELREISKEAKAGLNGDLDRADEALKRIELLSLNILPKEGNEPNEP